MEKQERHLLVGQLFQAALALPPHERAAFLDTSCGHDPDLLREVQSLLSADDEARGFLSSPPLQTAATLIQDKESQPFAGRSFGHYRILDLLGRGGMGEVYRARDTRLARDVAIKFVPKNLASDESRLRRLEREARMLASLNHPNIATIHGLEYFGETRLLVMELVEGETLDERIARGPVPLDQALGIFRQIAEALEAAHQRGVIHRDLKPANVKVSPDGKVKLLDFGLAKALDIGPRIGKLDAESLASLTESGLILGTPGYMSPEQARGEAAEKSTDIWAFGCVLYETLTGRKAFRGKSVPEILSSVLRDEPDWNSLPAQTPQSLRQLMQQCCKKEKSERLQDMSDARVEIDECLQLQQPSKKTSRSFVGYLGAGRPGRRAAIFASVALIGLLAVLLALKVLNVSRSKPTEPVTLAVLPLQVLTSQEQIGYLGVGISDAIITRLANIAQLRVRPTSSILRYKDEPPDVQEAAKTLNAENVLSGTLQQVGSRLRVSVQLIRASDAAPLRGPALRPVAARPSLAARPACGEDHHCAENPRHGSRARASLSALHAERRGIRPVPARARAAFGRRFRARRRGSVRTRSAG